MMEILRHFLRRFKEPLFLLFVAVALAVWCINKLNATFQRDAVIPLYIEGVVNPAQNRNDSYFEISCRLRGKGYNFILLEMFPTSKMVEITAAELFDEDNYSQLTNINLNLNKKGGKIASLVNGFEMLNIYDAVIKIPVVQTIQKLVKISPNITVDIEGGYRGIGTVEIEPKEVLISGDAAIVSSIDSVFTEKKVITRGRGTINDIVGLEKINGVNFSQQNINFTISTDRFTEHRFEVKPTIELCDTTLTIADVVALPTNVEVRFNCAQSVSKQFSERDFELYATFSKEEMIGDDLYELKVRNLPLGVSVQSIDPQFITIVKSIR